MQTVYVKILGRRARFDGKSSFKTWLLALIRHTAADEWRRRKRQPVARSDEDAAFEQYDPEAGPDESLQRLEVQTALAEVETTATTITTVRRRS